MYNVPQEANEVDIARAVVQSLFNTTTLNAEGIAKVLAISIGAVIFNHTPDDAAADFAIDELVKAIKTDMHLQRQTMQADTRRPN